MDEKPQRESWLRGYVKFLVTLFGAAVLGYFGELALEMFLPPLVSFIFIGLLVIAVVYKGFHVLWKVFRPDDPADLSLLK